MPQRRSARGFLGTPAERSRGRVGRSQPRRGPRTSPRPRRKNCDGWDYAAARIYRGFGPSLRPLVGADEPRERRKGGEHGPQRNTATDRHPRAATGHAPGSGRVLRGPLGVAGARRLPAGLGPLPGRRELLSRLEVPPGAIGGASPSLVPLVAPDDAAKPK